MFSNSRKLKIFRIFSLLMVFVFMVCASACGSDSSQDEAPVSSEDISNTSTLFSGTYEYTSDTYRCAMEFDEFGSLWFYEELSDGTVKQGMVATVETIDMSGTDTPEGCYWLPFYYVDFNFCKAAYVRMEMADGSLNVTPLDSSYPLSDYISTGDTITLSPTENLSLSQLIVSIYADELAG